MAKIFTTPKKLCHYQNSFAIPKKYLGPPPQKFGYSITIFASLPPIFYNFQTLFDTLTPPNIPRPLLSLACLL